MKVISVSTTPSYPVSVGDGLFNFCGRLMAQHLPTGRCMLVSDSCVFPLYGERVKQGLIDAGFSPSVFTFPAGESSKTLSTYAALLSKMAEEQLCRSDCVIALGGGVTGDLAGFAAATYQRGIPLVQLPTSLLAAVDASVGGKTAVNLPHGKNLVGSFWQPRLVLCDTSAFATLSPAAQTDGWAEILKHALLASPSLFRQLSAQGRRCDWEDLIVENIRIKARFVAEDPFDRQRRQCLNFGHTLGHAIEQLSGYTLSHGHAVSVGMMLAVRGAEQMGYTRNHLLTPLRNTMERLELPTKCLFSARDIARQAWGDKKRQGNTLPVVLLSSVGAPVLRPLTFDELTAWTEAALW